jgi:class 3 adenylate cyclase
VRCRDCGKENAEGMLFCGFCGSRLPAPPEAAPEVAAAAEERAPRPAAPAQAPAAAQDPAARAAAAAAGPPPAGPAPASGVPPREDELRLVTVLFADLVGFTRLSQERDPEEVGELLNECFDRLVPCVERHGGTVDKFMGDALMALFGAPIAHDNDPVLAVRAALDMRAALAEYAREKGLDLGLHLGVNTGRVLAAGLGGGGRRDYSVVGDAVNVAARLQQMSQPGEVLIGDDTFRLAEHLLVAESRGKIAVKGRTQPVGVYKVLGLRERPPEQPTRALRSPLVGRHSEQEAFEQALDRLAAGSGGVMVVLGQAGLGKSRLVAEVRGSEPGQTVEWHEGRCTSLGKVASYAPFRDLIRADCGISPEESPDAALAKLEARVDTLFPEEGHEVFPYLASICDVAPEGYAGPAGRLPPDSFRRLITITTRRYIERMGESTPTVLVFEDAHWMDDSSAALLEQLLSLSREVPLLFCLVGRPDVDSPLTRLVQGAEARGVVAARVELSPLDDAASFQLIRNLVGWAIAHDLALSIEKRAEGNPLFIEQVIHALVDMNTLEQDGHGGWRALATAVPATLPDTMEGLIVARIDRLPEHLRRMLKTASVIGRIFPAPVLASIERDPLLAGYLRSLQERQFIHGRAGVPSDWVFQHVFIQEAAYNSLLARQRRDLHRQIAQAIERMYDDRLPETVGHLAYHYSKAEAWERAEEYMAKAGDLALAMAADAEALAHFESALSAAGNAGDRGGTTADVALTRATLWRKIAGLRAKQHHMAEWSTAIEAAEREIERARDDSVRWWEEWIEVKLQHAWGFYHQGAPRLDDLEAAVAELEPFVAARGSIAQKGRLLDAQIAGKFGRTMWDVDDECIEMARRLYALPCDSEADRAKYCFTLGFALLMVGETDESEPLLLESLDSAMAAGDLVQRLLTLNYLACLARARGEVEKAERLAGQTLALATDLDVQLYQATAAANLAWVHWKRGEDDAARRRATEALNLLASWPYFLRRLARWPFIDLLLKAGETEQAIEHARALVVPPEQPCPATLHAAIVNAIAAGDRGDPAEAARLLRAAHTLANELGRG